MHMSDEKWDRISFNDKMRYLTKLELNIQQKINDCKVLIQLLLRSRNVQKIK